MEQTSYFLYAAIISNIVLTIFIIFIFVLCIIIMIFIIDMTSIFMVAMLFITIGTISDTNLFVYTRSGLGTQGGLAQVYQQYTSSVPRVYLTAVYHWCFDIVPIPHMFEEYQRFTQKVN